VRGGGGKQRFSGAHVRGSGPASANLWASEVDDRAVVLKQVNFLDCWNVIHAETLERVLQAFVICSGGLVHGLLLPPNRALASSSDRGL
jgi:hypothetical protein